MILYRLFIRTYSGWVVQWHTTEKEAKRIMRDLPDRPASIERMDVPTDKAGLCEALNRAHANPINWPGEKVK